MIGIETLVSIIVTLSVFPLETLADVSHVAFRDSVSGGECIGIFPANESLADFQRLRFRESGETRPFTECVPPLGNAIVLVVCVGSKEQVRVVDAWRIVAAVEDFHSRRYWSTEQLVRRSMGKHNLPAFLAADSSIAIVVRKSSPQNAAVLGRITEELRKPIPKRYSAAGTLARLGAEASGPNQKSRLRYLERRTAHLANAINHDTLLTRHFGPPDRFGLFRGSRQLLAGGSLASFYHKGKHDV